MGFHRLSCQWHSGVFCEYDRKVIWESAAHEGAYHSCLSNRPPQTVIVHLNLCSYLFIYSIKSYATTSVHSSHFSPHSRMFLFTHTVKQFIWLFFLILFFVAINCLFPLTIVCLCISKFFFFTESHFWRHWKTLWKTGNFEKWLLNRRPMKMSHGAASVMGHM